MIENMSYSLLQNMIILLKLFHFTLHGEILTNVTITSKYFITII